jgi:prepilin-type N-terminal cleavage/methylation domain-containing protein
MTIDKRSAAGFTLVEMAVVILISGLLVAIAVGGMTTFMRASRLAGAATTAEADLHWARSLATTQRKTCAVLFSSGAYAIVHFSPAETLRTRTMPRGVTCSATDTATFYAWGLTDPMTITLTDTHNTRQLHLATDGKVTR